MFPERLSAAGGLIQAHFDLVLGALDPLPMVQAMAHATNGGKRLRGFMVLESARLHGVNAGQAIWPATAIEALHAYSLVHDDLPCMDNDDLRRGLPTVHVKWDEAIAVLAGDALQTLAVERATQPCAPIWPCRWRGHPVRKAWCWVKHWTLLRKRLLRH